MITLIIADDHPVFRRGLIQVLESDPALRISAEVGNGEEALAAIERHQPDIAVLDIDMPKMNGLEVMKALKKRQLSVSVIVLTMYDEERMFNKALDLGVMGYVLKESAVSDILQSVKTVASGKHFISPSISDFLVRRSRGQVPNVGVHGTLSDLTPSERRILRLISENKTSKEIAEELSISIHTVENHRAHICDKLNITGNNALLRFALEHKSLL
jgi:DNA-binding NarL/FixJ family response regulator